MLAWTTPTSGFGGTRDHRVDLTDADHAVNGCNDRDEAQRGNQAPTHRTPCRAPRREMRLRDGKIRRHEHQPHDDGVTELRDLRERGNLIDGRAEVPGKEQRIHELARDERKGEHRPARPAALRCSAVQPTHQGDPATLIAT